MKVNYVILKGIYTICSEICVKKSSKKKKNVKKKTITADGEQDGGAVHGDGEDDEEEDDDVDSDDDEDDGANAGTSNATTSNAPVVNLPPLPDSSLEIGVLPRVTKTLVDRRRRQCDARSTIFPEVTNEAKEMLIESYIHMRSANKCNSNVSLLTLL